MFHRSLQVLALAALSGCALGIQGPDPDRPRHQVPRCDTGKGGVATDGVLATGLTLGAIAAFDEDANSAGLTLLALGGLFVASAIRGNTAANACSAAFRAYTATPPPPLVDEEPRQAIARARPPAPIAAPPPVEVPQVTTPALAPPPPPKPAVAKPAVTKPRADGEDDWSVFWKEVLP